MSSSVTKVLTEVGYAALRYMKNPDDFPANCPDPRDDAEGFKDYVIVFVLPAEEEVNE